MEPVLEFARFPESRHTGSVLARWKLEIVGRWKLVNAVGLATEDGASNNKKANRILQQDFAVCSPHDTARAVLIASGMSGNSRGSRARTPT